MKRTALALAVVAGAISVGAVVLPRAWPGWQETAAAHDPAALSQLRLQGAVDRHRMDVEVDRAIEDGDSELAESLIDLAAEHGIAVADERRQRLAVLKDEATTRALKDFGSGFLSGERITGAGLAGAVTGDVVGFGDLRDLASEGQKLARGEAPDQLVLTLAAAGLAISAATWVSLGGGLPVRGGLSLVKTTAKAGKLSPRLAASLGRMTAGAIDRPALSASLAAAAKFDLAAARMASAKVVRPAALTRIAALGQHAGAVYSRLGQGGLRQVLAISDEAADLGRAARLATAKPSTARAVLKVLGRSALVLGALSLTTVSWMLALVGYAIALAMLAQRLGWWLGRRRPRAVRPA